MAKTAKNQRKPPSHLSPASKRFWAWVDENFELREDSQKQLLIVCENLDKAERARLTLEKEGDYFTDRHGAVRIHPAINVQRDAHVTAMRALRELGIAATADAPRPPALAWYEHNRETR